MKKLLLIATITTVAHAPVCSSQNRLVGEKFEAYFDWFHQQSQVVNQFTDGATLVIFSPDAKVHTAPIRGSTVLGQLPIGHEVRNHLKETTEFPQDQVDGYGDLWFQVSSCDAHGRKLMGFVWGGDLAKAWKQVRLEGQKEKSLVMLGIPSEPRIEYSDIRAELRTLYQGRLINRKVIPGLCVFEECGSSTLLRTVDNCPRPGLFILEASTLTAGCMSAVEKAFFHWTGQDWQRFYYAEYTTAAEYANTPFEVSTSAGVELCRYSHENRQYNPVLSCKQIPDKSSKTKEKKGRAKPRA